MIPRNPSPHADVSRAVEVSVDVEPDGRDLSALELRPDASLELMRTVGVEPEVCVIASDHRPERGLELVHVAVLAAP